jgi:hypothetical protein
MYCNYCGTQNPDDFRFCQKCGKPRVGSTPAAPAAAPASTGDVVFVRSICLNAAAEFEKNPEQVGNPLRLLDFDRNKSRFSFLLTITDAQVDELVKLDLFTAAEKTIIDREPYAVITYLRMLWDLAEAYQCQKLIQGIFLTKSFVMYQSNLDHIVQDKDWKALDALTSEYVEEGRKANYTLLLTRALVKAAHAKLMLGDRYACRQLLDEFYRIADAAQRERPLYTYLSDESARLFFLGVKNQADTLKSKV